MPASFTIDADAGTYSMAYGNGVYVVVKSTGSLAAKILSSTDLISWSEQTFAVNSDDTRYKLSVFFINNIFILFGHHTLKTLTSADGITWQESALNNVVFGAGYTHKMAFFKNRYFINSYYGNGLSASAINDPLAKWTDVPVSSGGSQGISTLDTSPTSMCCVPFNGDAIFRTTNGTTFTKVFGSGTASTSGLSAECDIIYVPWANDGAGRWLASVPWYGKVLYSDDDGLTWLPVAGAPLGRFLTDNFNNIIIMPRSKTGIYVSQDEGMTFFGDLSGVGSTSGLVSASNGTNIIFLKSGARNSFVLMVLDPITPFATQRNTPILKDANATFYYVRAKK